MKRRLLTAAVLVLALVLSLAALVSCGEKVKENGSLDLLNMDLTPYIELGDYRSLPFELEIKKVTEADVEGAIEEFKASLASYEEYVDAPVNRATIENDYLMISYVGRVDGEIVDQSPSSAPQYLLLADGNGYYDWINSALRGVFVGDTVIAEGQLAERENYGEYSGKIIVYEITLEAILGHYTFTELTDEVLFERTGYSSLEEYREALYGILEQERKQAALATIYQEAWEKAQELSKILKYPKKQVNYYYNAFYGNYSYIAYQNNVTVDVVLAQYGLDEDKVRDMAEQSTAEELFYYALVQAEGLTVTDEEYAERVTGIAEGQGVSVEELEAEYGKDYIRDSMLYDEAIIFLANAVDVTYTYSE